MYCVHRFRRYFYMHMHLVVSRTITFATSPITTERKEWNLLKPPMPLSAPHGVRFRSSSAHTYLYTLYTLSISSYIFVFPLIIRLLVFNDLEVGSFSNNNTWSRCGASNNPPTRWLWWTAFKFMTRSHILLSTTMSNASENNLESIELAMQIPLPASNLNPSSVSVNAVLPSDDGFSSIDSIPSINRNQSSLPPVDKGFGAWSFVRILGLCYVRRPDILSDSFSVNCSLRRGSYCLGVSDLIRCFLRWCVFIEVNFRSSWSTCPFCI